MRVWLLVTLFAVVAGAATDSWLARVEPLITPAEKKAYLTLSPEARPAFASQFWAGKQITEEEFDRRQAHVDERFGSGKAGSGINTDRGRVYLSLGEPDRVTRLASSRNFVPIEIWYYNQAPALHITYELQLLFFERNATGEYRLYSPGLNSIRDLMNPQAATRGLFGVNDIVTEADVRTRLTLSPAEDDVIMASLGVARGITGMGNDEILALAASPRRALSKESKPRVESRFVTAHPSLTIFQTLSQYGAPQVDLMLDMPVRKSVALEVWQGAVSIYRQETSFAFDTTKSALFEQRLDLLPGQYRVLFTVDGTVHPYPLHVSAPETVSDLLIGEPSEAGRAGSPFEFGGIRVDPTAHGNVALLQNVKASGVEWRLRRGATIIWNRKVTDERFASLDLSEIKAPAGEYELEARAEGATRTETVWLEDKPASANTVISHNANLAPGERLRLLARQHLIQGKVEQARTLLRRAKVAGGGWSVDVDMGRIDALQGRYDEARARFERVLRFEPRNVEAVVALAFVEAQLQDYTIAAKLYRQALDIQPSAAIEQALAGIVGK